MDVVGFDFNGSSGDFRRTPQGFLRVSARLTRTGVFAYESGREYRSDDEVFRADSLESIKGAPVTDLHPSEKGGGDFLTAANAKSHIVGITEHVERDGPYLKGSLIIFHEDMIKAIEAGERKEISLGYRCRLEQTSGVVNCEVYDAIQRDIVVNHVAIGPKGWGRAGPDCFIRVDNLNAPSSQGKTSMTEKLRFDGVDIALTHDAISAVLSEKKRQVAELHGRLDAMGVELERAQAAKAALEDPRAIESKVQARLKLIEACRCILDEAASFEGKTDEELKLSVIKKFHPDLDVSDKEQSYLDGMFEIITATRTERNDSLALTRQTLFSNAHANSAYEKWLEQSAKLWTAPLTGSMR